jgi:hypothetical protein
MLQKSILTEGFEGVKTSNEAVFESVAQEVEGLREQIGQGLTPEEFQSRAKEVADQKTEGMFDRSIDQYAQVLAAYLNQMQDPFGDPPMQPFTLGQTRPIFEPIGRLFEAPGSVDAQVQSAWAALFPVTFQLATPPPGSVQKTSSIGAVAPLPPVTPALTGASSYDDAFGRLADTIHQAASSIVVTVNHLVSTPSGPAPGPPIVKPVQ